MSKVVIPGIGQACEKVEKSLINSYLPNLNLDLKDFLFK